MRINNKQTLGLLVLLLTSSLYAEVIKGSIYCGSSHQKDNDKIVVFVNGINNSIESAEKSRKKLELKLREENICSSENNCVVEKYYNQTQGYINDVQELNFVGNLERNVSNLALRRLAVYMNIDYLKYRDLLKKKPGFNLKDYSERDKKVLAVLREMTRNAALSESEVQISFKNGGLDISGWLCQHLVKKAHLPSPYNSLVTAVICDKKDFYNAKFKSYFQGMMHTAYLASRNFYGNDSSASRAITKSVDGLVSYLEELLLSGKKVVVVAHSQGNHIIELAYSILREKWGIEALNAIQVVGVGVVSSTTPTNTYLTWDNDFVVNSINDAVSDGEQLKSNFSSDKTIVAYSNNHSFLSVYMNHTLRGQYHPDNYGNLSGVQAYLTAIENNPAEKYPIDDWIAGLVKGSLDEAVPYANEISSAGVVTASLRWEQYDDMDLWTNEDNQNIVSYQDLIGIFDSELDRDDTDGEGPEHYISNLSCEELQYKTWSFGIHQYDSGGSPAIAHFSIKIGNANLVQKTYSLLSWPPDIQWIGRVSFEKMKDNLMIPYTIELADSI